VRRRRLERQLDALRDGLLDEREAREVEHLLESSSDAGHFLRRTSALRSAVRDAWQDGPAAPPAEQILSALRPELDRVDAEVDAPSRLRRWLATVREAPRLAPSLATAGAALVLALAILVAPPPTGTESPSPEGGQDAPLSASESTVYDLVAESGSVMLYEADDVTILWVSDDEDEVSRHGTPRAGWA
jgi:anti-sigma factor RsiW